MISEGVAQAVRPREHAEQAVETAGPEQIKKQAIVVVHGQGQQRPMGTVREFVMSLWQYNPQLTVDPPPAGEGRDYWIVPDGKSGLFELQRVTTPPYKDPQGERRTDFFEFYYADLFENTPVRNLWRWLQRLLFVDPKDIPPRMIKVWRLLWVLTLLTMALLIWVIANIPTILETSWTIAFFDPPVGLDCGCEERFVWSWPWEWSWSWPWNWPWSRLNPAGWIAIAVALLGVAIEHLPRLSDKFVRLRPIPVLLARGLIFIALVVIIAATNAWPVLGAIVIGVVGYYGATFVLPLFGDAASYLSAQSETVQSRQSVRTRGLALLRALHDDPGYDRIVVVAHSLGTVVAYDLMQLLWEAVGPTKDNVPDASALAALKLVDAFVATKAGESGWSATDVDAYQQLQWNAFNELRRQPGAAATATTTSKPRGWKVSDFVTLGSPLGNASFLVAKGGDEFELLKQERLMPTSPPMPFDPKINATSFLDPHMNNSVTHHAAVFSVVRWTNIWDPVDEGSISMGDFISSPVKGPANTPESGPTKDVHAFGEGIAEHRVRILKSDGKTRGFTHNDYWRDPSGTWTAVLPHLTTLRDAVGIMRF
jgi:hypothetical protein